MGGWGGSVVEKVPGKGGWVGWGGSVVEKVPGKGGWGVGRECC